MPSINVWNYLCAEEISENNFQRLIGRCSRDAIIADDYILYGTVSTEHDSNLRKVLARLEEQELTPNGDNYLFRLPRLTFFGRELDHYPKHCAW